MQHLIVFNAPKRSGKSYARNLVSKIIGAHDCAFSDILYDSVPLLYGIEPKRFMNWCNTVDVDGVDEKDKPKEELFGMKPRDALIDISENYLKPKFGRDCIAQITARKVKQEPVVVMDSGFVDELSPFIDALGIPTENVYLIHINRPNHTWDGDSRHTIHPWGDMKHIVIENDGDIMDFQNTVRDLSIDIMRDIQMKNNIECIPVDVESSFDYRQDKSIVSKSLVSIDMNNGQLSFDEPFNVRSAFYRNVQLYSDHAHADLTSTTASYKAIYQQGLTVKDWCDLHSSMGGV